MNKLRMRIGGTVLAAGMLMGACGGDSLTPEQQADRDSAVDEMVEAGIDKGDAECFIDKMVDKFGIDTMDDDDFEPSTEQAADMLGIMGDCNIDLADL